MKKLANNSFLFLAVAVIEFILRLLLKYEINFSLLDGTILLLEALICVIAAFILLGIYGLVNLCFPKAPLIIKSAVTGIIGMVPFYLLNAFGGGFTILLKPSPEAIRALVAILLCGLIVPYLKISIDKNAIQKPTSVHH